MARAHHQEDGAMPDPAPTDPSLDEPVPPPEPPEPPLGDAGKKALDAEREARKAAEAKARKLDEELAELRKAQMSDQEKAIEAAKAAARSEADADWSTKYLRAQARAAAAGKLADPNDAVALLDLSKIPVADGEVDVGALEAAIDALVAAKPYLGVAPATPGKQPTPTVPGGPRGDGKGSITREQLKTMKPEQIAAAHKAGELDHLLKG